MQGEDAEGKAAHHRAPEESLERVWRGTSRCGGPRGRRHADTLHAGHPSGSARKRRGALKQTRQPVLPPLVNAAVARGARHVPRCKVAKRRGALALLCNRGWHYARCRGRRQHARLGRRGQSVYEGTGQIQRVDAEGRCRGKGCGPR